MTGEHVFWITSRAAGMLALIAAGAAVTIGLLMSTRLLKGRDLRVLHEALSVATLAALAVHALALLGDGYLQPSVADIAIPFVSSYQRLWMGVGIIGGWALLILGLSYYARGRIGAARWRKLHRLTAVAWLLGVAHAIGQGTDAGTVWFAISLIAFAGPPFALLVWKLSRTPSPAPAAR